MIMSEKMYIVKYSKGDYDNYIVKDIFVTNFKSRASVYVAKFNRNLRKWNKYYSQYEERTASGFIWIKDEYFTRYFNRWESLKNINRCWCEEIEIR